LSVLFDAPKHLWFFVQEPDVAAEIEAELNAGATAENLQGSAVSETVGEPVGEEVGEQASESNAAVAVAEEVHANSGEKCCICQQPLRGSEGPVMPLEATLCGHVHHQQCLESWWNFQNCRGACPYKCQQSVPMDILANNVSPSSSAHQAREPSPDDDDIVENLVQEVEMRDPAPAPMVL
jgi:hypothetical protein